MIPDTNTRVPKNKKKTGQKLGKCSNCAAGTREACSDCHLLFSCDFFVVLTRMTSECLAGLSVTESIGGRALFLVSLQSFVGDVLRSGALLQSLETSH